ncbi:MAG: tetratricopeptide repeat protein [Nostoc sp.]
MNANGTAQRDGYNIIYTNHTLNGMSGGAVLNEQGEVVAVHGRVDEQAISEKSQDKITTDIGTTIGLGTTIYSAARQMLAVGVDLGVDLPSSNVASAPKADDFYIKANEKYRQKDYRGAITNYSEAIRLNPNYAEAYLNRGYTRSDLGDKQGAIADYNQALQINPKYADAYYQRGRVQLNDLKEETSATRDFQKAADLYFEQGKKADGYRSQGVIRSILKDYQGAITVYTQSIKLNPNDLQAYINRGIARHQSGDNRGAIADFNAALKINPNLALAYNNRGNAHSDLGDKQEAIADFNAAIKINPNFALAYYNRGNARRQLGDKQGAIADYNAALKINPNSALAYNNRGNARRQLGDNQGAIADYNAALKINPKYALAYNNRGVARHQLGDNQGAIVDLKKGAELFRQQGNRKAYQNTLELIRKYQQ